ncbi:stress enhanced protein 1, chloroplastic [Nicotiana tabacum]|uniref:Stress enhanced protein 1, chloroplastic n=1 Tax=Nicotiana tabacum TaxID=4097 RepID=A0A1S3ZQU9_TOBAC|nr:stress enhanced protein 1, chloroplastic [Nicotiana tomentosiformis]XP_016466756.1 PREDICTED: stress enhanced protein 1, chloroplastic-like [Nicotiana tabacum]
MAVVQISSSLCTSIRDVVMSNPVSVSSVRGSTRTQFGTVFATGSPLLIRNSFYRVKAIPSRATSVSIRCGQSTKEEGNLDVWLGRSAMVGFAVAISVEIATGKGLLENFGVTGPLPTVALAVTALVGILAAVFIFQSASKN